MILKQVQTPNYKLFHTGDTISYLLELSSPISGKAFIRTTINNAKIRRKELMNRIEFNSPLTGEAWQDLPMEKINPNVYQIDLPLIECGIFESKCFFIPADGSPILWVNGGNAFVKVESVYNKAGNSIYTAFVRQFELAKRPINVPENLLSKLDEQGYTVIPKSGTFRQLKGQIDFIINELKCRIIQLLPIHPAPTVYGRMGRFGSPFASLDYFAVDPALADFDVKASPMEQFIELVDHIHSKNARIFLDLPVNHTGWASKLQAEHPDYFVRKSDKTFESPGAWGIVWEDLCKLNYNKKEMYFFMAKVFLFWCKYGVDGFRCDAGYMVPEAAWDYIVAKVREEYPDTVFMLEGLGGPIDVQNRLLDNSDLDWAYSELFQNYTKEEIVNYGNYMNYLSKEKGTLVNFAETHDNARLASKGKKYTLVRCAVNALLANSGAFGFANGVEFLADEKIDVHSNSDLKWGNQDNLVKELGRLNSILHIHKSFSTNAKIDFIHQNHNSALMFKRQAPDGDLDFVYVLINLNTESATTFEFDIKLYHDYDEVFDLFGEKELKFEFRNNLCCLTLEPGESVVLCNECHYRMLITSYQQRKFRYVPVVREQLIDFMILKSYLSLTNRKSLPLNFNLYESRTLFQKDPELLLQRLTDEFILPILHYSVEHDRHREILCGLEKILLIKSEKPFSAKILDKNRLIDSCKSIKLNSGEFATILRIEDFLGENSRELTIQITKFEQFNRIDKFTSPIFQVSEDIKNFNIKFRSEHHEITNSLMSLHTNSLSAMSQIRGKWSNINSKYDAILSANCNPRVPVDKYVMFSRCRVWLVLNDFSQELNFRLQKAFITSLDNMSEWIFSIPVGQGAIVQIVIRISLANNGNGVKMEIFRHFSNDTSQLAPEIPVKIILRPDVDDRIAHSVTKALNGAENSFKDSVTLLGNDGFEFGPNPERRLEMRISQGRFIHQNEWEYMVNLPFEEYYGLEHNTDIFSPGYFEFELKGNEYSTLDAIVKSPGLPATTSELVFPKSTFGHNVSFEDNLKKALRHFVVKRDEYHTVIAGYPWFLDWGRDTLIALRGLICYDFLEESSNIIRQFAKFEKNGTIPNMIRGNDDSNRDTSDAPLWLFVATEDYIKKVGSDEILLAKVDNERTLKEVLVSIVDNYLKGTPNNIKCDSTTLLVASPSHFTWMDTNYPAATPRQGYAIEIQALWYRALSFLGNYFGKYKEMATILKASFNQYFFVEKYGRFADCLHIEQIGMTPSQATADDHIRPNQLLAITLGLVTDKSRQLNILDNCEELLISGAIRSLADRNVDYKLPVYLHGQLLNNPHNPYYGRYNGPEDTERKVAYHNGTAWGWLFPSYMEALFIAGGDKNRQRALLLLLSAKKRLDGGVPGQLPEVVEGNYPHNNGGCLAQAWSTSEFARVYRLLK